MSLPPEQREEIEEIVERAVEKTLLKLGIDVSTPDRVVQLQDDFRYMRDFRASMAQVRQAGLIAAIGTIVTGAIAAIWLGLQHMVRGGDGS